jgi:hypothetical protein
LRTIGEHLDQFALPHRRFADTGTVTGFQRLNCAGRERNMAKAASKSGGAKKTSTAKKSSTKKSTGKKK